MKAREQRPLFGPSHAPANFYPALNGGDAAILFSFVFLLFVFAGPGALSAHGALSKKQP